MKKGGGTPSRQGPGRDDDVHVDRADILTVRRNVRQVYENAVAAAHDGLIDFQPFDGLPEAIRILDAALAEEWTS